MTPILGIIASSTTAARLGDYESIATATVTSATQASIDFTNIPQTYTHLQLRIFARNNRANTTDGARFRFNNGSTTDYATHGIRGGGDSVTAFAGDADVYASSVVFTFTAANATANIFGTTIIDILDYANTNKNKVTRALGGTDMNGSGHAILQSNLWVDTSAINRITIETTTGTDSWVQYSHFALYGIKG
jgi:hypothetical protein